MTLHFIPQDPEYKKSRDEKHKGEPPQSSAEKLFGFFKAIRHDDLEEIKKMDLNDNFIFMAEEVLRKNEDSGSAPIESPRVYFIRDRLRELIKSMGNGELSFDPELNGIRAVENGAAGGIDVSVSHRVILFCLKCKSINCLRYFKDKKIFWDRRIPGTDAYR